MQYRVGQVLYVVVNKKMQVYPMMVVEEITKKTLHGEQTNYVLQGGSDPESTLLLSQVDGEVFETPDEAKYVLTSRATAQIGRLVDAAVSKASEWYDSSTSQEEKHAMTFVPTQSSEEENSVKVTLPDGTVANLKSGVI